MPDEPAPFLAPLPPDSARFIHPMDRQELIRYCERLRLAHGTVRLLGLPEIDERNDDLPLASLFVEPRVSPQHILPSEAGGTAAEASTRLLDALGAHQRLVLLGDPGMGKSTVVNWLCTALAQPLENPVTAALGRLIPLPFILRDLAPWGAELTWAGLLERFLALPIAAVFAGDRALLETLLASGQALLLLDGIDEVGSSERREALRAAVREGWKREDLQRCRWVLTSRVVGYEEVAFDAIQEASEEFGLIPVAVPGKTFFNSAGREVRMFRYGRTPNTAAAGAATARGYLAPFTDAQVRQFIDNWYRLRDPDPERAADTARLLAAAIASDDGIRELAGIPNLLTLIALVYRVRAKLPDGRGELYTQIAAAYLKTIDEYRSLADLPPYELEEKMEWLARVGWEMQLQRAAAAEAGRAADSKKDPTRASEDLGATTEAVQGWLVAAMRARFGDAALAEAGRFLTYLQRRTGLLVERGAGRFYFLHLSFQEFFAARHLAEHEQVPAWSGRFVPAGRLAGPHPGAEDDAGPLSFAALRRYCGETRWQEVLVFLAETLPRKWADPILTRLYPESTAPAPQGEPTERDYSATESARWLLAARLVSDPHVALTAETRAALLRACWRWELRRYSAAGPDSLWEGGNGVARQLLGRRDTAATAWTALHQAWPRVAGTALDLAGCTAVSDLTPLQSLAGLRKLDLSGCTAVNDLTPLQNLAGLQTLSLSGCTAVNDLTPLQNLAGLQWLFLSGCTAVSDLTPLQSLAGLQRLSLFGCTAVSDLTPLQSLASLQQLDLNRCTAVSDLTPLQSLAGLQWLFLSGCTAGSAEALAALKGALPGCGVLR